MSPPAVDTAPVSRFKVFARSEESYAGLIGPGGGGEGHRQRDDGNGVISRVRRHEYATKQEQGGEVMRRRNLKSNLPHGLESGGIPDPRLAYFESVQAAVSRLPVPLIVMFIGCPFEVPLATTVNLMDSGVSASATMVPLVFMSGLSHMTLASNLLCDELDTLTLQDLVMPTRVEIREVFFLDAVLAGG